MSLDEIIRHRAQNASPHNTVEFEVSGKYGLFCDPIFKLGGEKFSYAVPTHSALRGVLMSIYSTVQCPRLRICSEVGQVNASILSPGNTHAMISSIQGDISLILRGFSEIAAAIIAPIQRHNWIVSRKEKSGKGELTGRIYSNTGAVTIR